MLSKTIVEELKEKYLGLDNTVNNYFDAAANMLSQYNELQTPLKRIN